MKVRTVYYRRVTLHLPVSRAARGTEHALKPGQFMVLAVDAVNHKAQWASSVDLSHKLTGIHTTNSLPDDIDNPQCSET